MGKSNSWEVEKGKTWVRARIQKPSYGRRIGGKSTLPTMAQLKNSILITMIHLDPYFSSKFQTFTLICSQEISIWLCHRQNKLSIWSMKYILFHSVHSFFHNQNPLNLIPPIWFSPFYNGTIIDPGFRFKCPLPTKSYLISPSPTSSLPFVVVFLHSFSE